MGLEGGVLVGVVGVYLGDGILNSVGYCNGGVSGVVEVDGKVLGDWDYVVV